MCTKLCTINSINLRKKQNKKKHAMKRFNHCRQSSILSRRVSILDTEQLEYQHCKIQISDLLESLLRK
ncbi:hypothetical protein T05_4623 [Trichinella murrelli]|uniref:Uncharacterized protein n=1 Tax=Trichinella murrelli TaxID=144512 RepID=A0A0V0TVJ3_9BILA|nr:hypothetical protein T05_4623 [Trichinella murrelli]